MQCRVLGLGMTGPCSRRTGRCLSTQSPRSRGSALERCQLRGLGKIPRLRWKLPRTQSWSRMSEMEDIVSAAAAGVIICKTVRNGEARKHVLITSKLGRPPVQLRQFCHETSKTKQKMVRYQFALSNLNLLKLSLNIAAGSFYPRLGTT